MIQILGLIILVLAVVTFLGNLVCFVMMQSKMVKNGQATLATVSTIGLCVGGLGFLLAFIYGWTKAKEWSIEKFMRIWSAFVGAEIVLVVVSQVIVAVLGPGQ